MGNRITRTVLFAASALLSMGAFGAGAARFGTLRNADWVVTNAWQAVSNRTHDLIIDLGQEASLPPDWSNVSNAAMNAVQSLQPAYDYSDSAIQNFSSTNSVLSGGPYLKTSYEGATVGYSYSPRGEIAFHPSEIYVDGYSYLTQVVIISEETNGPLSSIQQYGGRFITARQEMENYISTNNPSFVSAVLAAPLVGADPSDLSELAEYGSYGTVGAAILALIAGLAALKRGKLDGAAAYPAWVQGDDYEPPNIVSHKGRLWSCQNYTIAEPGEEPRSDWVEVTIGNLKQNALTAAQLAAANSGATAQKVVAWDGYAAQIAAKADASDVNAALAQKADADALPYALVVPGEWEFSEPQGLTNFTVTDIEYSSANWNLYYTSLETGSDYTMVEGSLTDLSVTFGVGPLQNITVTATRASLPGHLADRAVNAVAVSTATMLTLPAAVTGKQRDFYVRLTVSATSAVTWTVAQVESWDAMGAPPSSFAAGTYLYRFTEVAPGVWHCEDMLALVGLEAALAAINGGVAP